MSYSFVYITASNIKEAEYIVGKLIEKKLGACGNIFPIRSIYRWKGRIEKSGEYAIIFKTKRDKVNRVINEVKRMHSYDVPCILEIRIDKGNKEYLEWIDGEI